MVIEDAGGNEARAFDGATRAAALRIDPDADLETMDFGLTLLRVGNRLQQDLEQQVHRPAGMTWAAFRVLFTIYSAEQITPMRLARLSSTSPASISSVLKTLDGYGMVERQVDETDRRVVLLSLSPRGEEAVAELFDRNNARVAEWVQVYSPEERAILVDLLLRMLHEPSPAPLTDRKPPIREASRGRARTKTEPQ